MIDAYTSSKIQTQNRRFTHTTKCPRLKENPAAQNGCSIGESFTLGLPFGCLLNFMCAIPPDFHSYSKSHMIDRTDVRLLFVTGSRSLMSVIYVDMTAISFPIDFHCSIMSWSQSTTNLTWESTCKAKYSPRYIRFAICRAKIGPDIIIESYSI